ncbi:MAG: glycosyltransferase [Burkholderiales bacterium]
MRRVLLIAFHFPPFQGSSGVQRTLSFCRSLPMSGWMPGVLTTHSRAFPNTTDDQLGDIPSGVEVKRAFALDSSRHLSFGGRYSKLTALPDRWITWLPSAVISGLRYIRKRRPDVLWSTYPIATAHVIAWALNRLTGVPWVADFRDPMVETIDRTGEQFPRDPRERRARLWVEALVARRAACAVFCTHSAREIFSRRYPEVSAERLRVIENGFDEEIFAEVERSSLSAYQYADRPLTLLHSGVLYRSTDRSPEWLLDALHGLVAQSALSARDLCVVLRASGNDHEYAPMIAARGLQDIVRLESPVGYREALAEMMAADGLLLLQGYTSNPAIPAKAYEYLRARRPIFALVDSDGETARLIERTGVGRIVPMDDPQRIASGLLNFIKEVRQGVIAPLSDMLVAQYSRQARAAELAQLFDSVVAASRVPSARSAP